MPSSEGRGSARDNFRRAWAAYERAVKKHVEPALGPLVRPLAEKMAGAAVVDLAGFWLVWQLEGGFEGLQRIGMSRAAIYRRVALFRRFYGAHPDEYRFEGVDVNLDAYLQGSGRPIAPRDTHPAKSRMVDKKVVSI